MGVGVADGRRRRSPKPSIRAATLADAPALAAIGGRAWNATYRGMVPDAVLDEWIAGAADNWRTALERHSADAAWRPWVAERAGTILGYATTSPAKDEWLPPPDGAGEVTNLYLDPDVIGTGIGRALYEHAVGDLRERGFTTVVIWAFRDNPRAGQFYERMGLAVDAATDWVLGGVPCRIVRFRVDWPVDAVA